jgi:hypothetical protein
MGLNVRRHMVGNIDRSSTAQGLVLCEEGRTIYQIWKVQMGGILSRFDPPVMNMQKPPVCCLCGSEEYPKKIRECTKKISC